MRYIHFFCNELHLPRKEFELLAFFMNQPNIIFSREELLSRIWEEDVFVVERTIDVHINRIRSKLGIYKNWIETTRLFKTHQLNNDLEIPVFAHKVPLLPNNVPPGTFIFI